MKAANEKFSRLLTEYVEKEQMSGSIQLMKNDEVIFRKNFGYANRETKEPIRDDTLFRFYSMSKPFTAIAFMQIYEKGLVGLHDRVCDVLPMASGLSEKVRIIHLLQHTSGLVETASADFKDQNGSVCYEDVIGWLAEQELGFEPGAGCEYRNTNYLLLSLIVEHYSGMKYREYMQKYIFDPLGMKTAVCELNDVSVSDRAIGYDKIDGVICPAGYVNMELLLGGGCIAGSMADATCLYRAVRNKLLLKESSWALMFKQPEVGCFGFGCMVITSANHLCYQNNGGHLGFRSLHKYFPEIDFDVILLSNSGYGRIREDVFDLITECYFTGKEHDTVVEMDKGFAN